MLILVGVTINVALNGGLFGTTEWAADQTKIEAEKEQLLAAVLAAVGTNGEVDFNKVVLPKDFTGSAGVYKSTKSGATYTVDPQTLKIDGGISKSETAEEDITGKYYSSFRHYDIKLNADGAGTFFGYGESEEGNYVEVDVGTLTYTYDNSTKILSITGTPSDDDYKETTGEFRYVQIKDENGRVINEVLDGCFINESVNNDKLILNKQNNEGLMPLTGRTYVNGTKAIEFGTTVEDGKTFGTYITKENEKTIDTDYYAAYNGKGTVASHEDAYENFTYSEDYSTITLSDGTVYTLKQN